MRDAIRAPPWGNLWRHLVTTYLFFFIIGFFVAFLSGFDVLSRWQWNGVVLATVAVSYVLAAIVVWSDIPWPGDPE